MKSIDRSCDYTSCNRSIFQPINQSNMRPVIRLINHAINQSNNYAPDQSSMHSINQSINQSTNHSSNPCMQSIIHAAINSFRFDVAFTSVLQRAIKTLFHIQEALDAHWIPVNRHWRLNERMYGALQGLNKSETAAKHGEKQVCGGGKYSSVFVGFEFDTMVKLTKFHVYVIR